MSATPKQSLPSRATIANLPKIELHVHLEGSTRPETLLRLAQRNKVEGLPTTVEEFEEFYRFRDFPHFVQVYVATTRCMRTADDLKDIAYDFAIGQAEQNVLYTEATYTATTVVKECGIPWDEQRDAIDEGLRRAFDETGAEVRLILDIVREFSAEDGQSVFEWTKDGLNRGLVCGLGLSGLELQTPLSRHADTFKAARDAKICISAHAGETKGADSIRETLEFVDPDRIGHGVRCLEDPKLVRELVERKIHLEVCPMSNVRLGVVPSFEKHPLPFLLDAGLSVSINSDDPPMFNTTLTEELQKASESFDLDLDMLYSLQLNAANAAFVSPERCDELRSILRENSFEDEAASMVDSA